MKGSNMSHIPLTKYWNPTSTFLRFLVVGVLNTIFGLSVTFILLHVFTQSYWMSTFIGNTVGAVCSFLLNRTFTFKSNVSYVKGGFRFIVIIFICYVASYSLSPIIASFLRLSPLLSDKNAAVLIGAMLYTITNYVGQKYFVFRK